MTCGTCQLGCETTLINRFPNGEQVLLDTWRLVILHGINQSFKGEQL